MTKFGVVSLLLMVVPALVAAARPASAQLDDRPRGVEGNERLTALTGGPLFVLFAAIAVTVLVIAQLLPEHYVIGFLLIPPLALKLGSTGYRFGRYYTHSLAYRLAGPPAALPRLIAPVFVLSTVAVFVTGVELWLFGFRFGKAWMTAHTLSAVIFFVATGLHLLFHFRRSAAATAEELRIPSSRQAITRRSLVMASLLLGAVLAAASLLYATPFPPTAAGA